MSRSRHERRGAAWVAITAVGWWVALGLVAVPDQAHAATSDPTALAIAEDQRVLHAFHVALHHHVAFLAPGRVETLVLPGRASPYRLPELARRAPQGIRLDHGRARLSVAVLALPGSTLVLDSHDASTILLQGGSRFVSIVGLRASILVRGHKGARLQLTSDGPRPSSGVRPYVAARGGTMEVSRADVSALGFGLGRTSGVAWLGGGMAVRGGAVDSTFLGNHDGAFASRAPGLRFAHDTFAHNETYGLELYDGTSQVLVIDSHAEANGRHGFLVSRGCAAVVFRRDGADGNASGGFVVDDGQDGTARGSDRALLTEVTAQRNGVVGIGVNGGSGSVVRRAHVGGGRFGVWVEHAAKGTTLDMLEVRGATNAGILLDGVSATTLRAVSTEGGKVGLLIREAGGTTVRGLRVAGARLFGVRLLGHVAGTRIVSATLAGRGPRPIDQRDVADGSRLMLNGTVTAGWVTSYHFSLRHWVRQHPTAWSWAPIIGLPLARRLMLRRGRRARFVLGRFPEDEVVCR